MSKRCVSCLIAGVLLLLAAGCTTDIFAAARAGDVAGLTRAIEAGTAVDAPDSDGLTPLMHAAAANHAAAVTALLRQGAKPDIAGPDGATALHLAAAAGALESVTALVEGGAEVNPLDRRRYTPLTKAMLGLYFDVADYLRAHGAR